jgi:glycosyltransferase involved in cell wall biosynthesis
MKQVLSKVSGLKIFTISNDGYASRVKSLYDSLVLQAEGGNEIDFSWVRLERKCEQLLPFEEIAENLLSGIPFICRQFNVTEASTSIKPRCFRYFFEAGYSTVIYIDPDCYFFFSPKRLFDLCRGHSAVLTPHISKLYDDQLSPSSRGILKSGAYNLGFCGLTHTSETIDFVDWWARETIIDCPQNADDGIFTDQRYCDLLPSVVEDTVILRDPAYNLAYWNVGAVQLSLEADIPHVNSSPLVFFHFSGLDEKRLREGYLSKYSTRRCASQVALNLAKKYLLKIDENFAELRSNGGSYNSSWSYLNGDSDLEGLEARFIRQALNIAARENPGILLSGNDRRSECEIVASISRVCSLTYLQRAFLNISRPVTWAYELFDYSNGGLDRVDPVANKSLRALYGRKSSMTLQFDALLSALDSLGVIGRRDGFMLSTSLLLSTIGPSKELVIFGENRLEDVAKRYLISILRIECYALDSSSLYDYLMTTLGDSSIRRARIIDEIRTNWEIQLDDFEVRSLLFTFDRFPELVCLKLEGRKLYGTLAREKYYEWVSDIADTPMREFFELYANESEDKPFDLCVYGYGWGISGLSFANRELLDSLKKTNRSVIFVPVEAQFDFEETFFDIASLVHFDQSLGRKDYQAKTSIYHINADMAIAYSNQIFSRNCHNRKMLYPIWELENLPEKITRSLEGSGFLIVAPSTYSNACYSKIKNISLVDEINYAVNSVAKPVDRTRNNSLKVLFALDVNSYMKRKGFDLCIELVKRANRKGIQAQYTLKLTGVNRYPYLMRDIIARHCDIKNLSIYSGNVDQRSWERLWSNIDVYVSLHRSEGFGLNIVTALTSGVPAIVTDYGGIVPELESPLLRKVSWEPTPVGTGQGPYPAAEVWAEPNVSDAIKHLEELIDSYPSYGLRLEEAERIGKRFSSDYISQKWRNLFQDREDLFN